MKEPPAEILRRLRPIPTTVGPPTTRPRDVSGVRPDGSPCLVEVVEAAAPVVLLFLSAACHGCRDLWEGLTELQSGLAGGTPGGGGAGVGARLAAVTRDPSEEDVAAIETLAAGAPEGVDVVMSSQAFGDYRVAGAPFLVVTGPAAVLVESVAWGVEQTLGIAAGALSGA